MLLNDVTRRKKSKKICFNNTAKSPCPSFFYYLATHKDSSSPFIVPRHRLRGLTRSLGSRPFLAFCPYDRHPSPRRLDRLRLLAVDPIVTKAFTPLASPSRSCPVSRSSDLSSDVGAGPRSAHPSTALLQGIDVFVIVDFLRLTGSTGFFHCTVYGRSTPCTTFDRTRLALLPFSCNPINDIGSKLIVAGRWSRSLQPDPVRALPRRSTTFTPSCARQVRWTSPLPCVFAAPPSTAGITQGE